MARKMVATIFPRHSVSRQDRDRLLTMITLLALDDLRGSRVIQWKSQPPPHSVLQFRNGEVDIQRAEKSRYVIKEALSDREIEEIVDRVEAILDRYNMSEDERDTLYTALPCLGLAKLQAFFDWKQPPPFDELG